MCTVICVLTFVYLDIKTSYTSAAGNSLTEIWMWCAMNSMLPGYKHWYISKQMLRGG